MVIRDYMDKVAESKFTEALQGKYRHFEGNWRLLVTVYAALVGLYHIYTAYAGPPFAQMFRTLNLTMIFPLIFMLYPASRRSVPHRPQLWDLVCILLTFVVGLNVLLNYGAIASRAGAPIMSDIVLGGVLVFLVIEAARRTVGWPIIVVAVTFLIYAYFGQSMPGILIHRGYDFSRIFPYLYLTDAGIFGLPMGVYARFIILFIVFGSFLDKCGAGVFFKDLSLALTGKYVGGPAKASVVFSAMIGSITGSSTANVVTTGTFTIPLMKKLGYDPAFAGGVEADASTGGQILPPVMGAAAFVMAEMIGVPYRDVMVAAAFPAFMYFATTFFMIHYRAKKDGLVGLPKSELPNMFETLKGGFYYFLPLFLLVYMLFVGRSPASSVFYAIILTVLLSWIKKETRMYPKDIFETISDGVIKALEVGAACAIAGIIIGMVTMTGLGLKFSGIIEQLAGGQLWMALPLTMIASLLLGMGVPTTAKYIILATLVAPALVTLGAPLMAAHLFILYFGTDADITPPVGLAAYAAAGLAGADPLRTGWEAMKMGITAYIIPFLIIYYPAIILDAPLSEMLIVFPTVFIACGLLGAAMQGYFIRVMPWWHRAVLAVGCVLLMSPTIMLDIIGASLIALIMILEYVAKRRDDMSEGMSVS
ncbi:TRAP transporter permease [Dethiobacter alkaliphilus]|uniref:TRAP transporter permease n=1 Tax=Dethiobacter alkaliphilus TaxID=427926 RepID=UPI002226C923|nr:TRAP transporter permease [Dethiobacter alkaliphilus]MCW3489684.1 TRAP transporter permease [Dethiobacter alkaliphilus]